VAASQGIHSKTPTTHLLDNWAEFKNKVAGFEPQLIAILEITRHWAASSEAHLLHVNLGLFARHLSALDLRVVLQTSHGA